MSVKGRQFTGKMQNNVSTLRDQYIFATMGKTGSGRVSLDTVGRKFAQMQTAQVVESGSTDNILKLTGHTLKEGWLVRIMTTANGILEEEILVDEVIDANNVRLSGFLSASLAAGDTVDIYKPVFERVAADGSSLATVVSPPIQIIKNGIVTTVEDSTNPLDVVAIPVLIKGVDGTNITVNAGDISVQNSAEGVNFDSIRVGDGTSKYAGITDNLELKTNDADALAELQNISGSVSSIDGKTPALGQAPMAASVPVVLASNQSSITVKPFGTLSTLNSTSVNLGAGATFTGVGEEVLDVGDIAVGIVASHDSALGGLKFEASPDNTNWFETDAYSYTSTNGIAVYSLAPSMRYFRLRYINGATLTTSIFIQTVYRAYYTKASSHRLEDFVNADNDAELVKAVLAAKKPDNTWTNIESTNSGHLKVSVQEINDPLPAGTNTIGKVDQGAAGAAAWPVSVASLPLPTGASTAANQATGNTSLGNINTVLGAQADAAATTDTGTFSLMSFTKREMQNWTTLLARTPVLGQAAKVGSVPVVLASDSDNLKINESNTAGQMQKNTLSASTNATAIAPANATGCFIKNQLESAGTLYYEIGGTANAVSADLSGGQGTAFIPCTGTISLFAGPDGACNYSVQWLIK